MFKFIVTNVLTSVEGGGGSNPEFRSFVYSNRGSNRIKGSNQIKGSNRIKGCNRIKGTNRTKWTFEG